MKNTARTLTALSLTTLTLAACGNPFAAGVGATEAGLPHPDAEQRAAETGAAEDSQEGSGAPSIPQSWLEAADAAWPDSEGFDRGSPILDMGDDCLIFDQIPEFAGESPDVFGEGFGSFGTPAIYYGNASSSSQEDYRYLCQLSRTDEQKDADAPVGSPSVQLMVSADQDHREETVENFLDEQDRPERVNVFETHEVDGVEIHTVEREFPTNDGNGGKLEALFHDEEAGALIHLELHSISSDELRAEHGHEGILEDLLDLLRQG